MKIVRGQYPPISSQYSSEIRKLVGQMLSRDERQRPNINQVLASPLITRRIRAFLNSSQIKEEFSHTIIHNKNIYDIHKEDLLRKKQENAENKKLPGVIPSAHYQPETSNVNSTAQAYLDK